MRYNINKDSIVKIETALKIIKNKRGLVVLHELDIISQELENMFSGSTFKISINDGKIDESNVELFIMSIYPELTTVNKIIEAVTMDKEMDAIKKLWENNKVWTIEIDSKIFNPSFIDFNEKELTALLLHEVGHIVASNSIPSRVSLILRYEITKASFKTRSLLKSDIFKTIFSLPIFDSCVADNKKTKSSIKEEIKADNFVKKSGYSNELYTALTKLSDNKSYKNKISINDKMMKVAAFSNQTLEDFQSRKDNIAKNNLIILKKKIHSPFIESVIDEILDTIFEDGENMYEGQKLEFMHERADEIIQDQVFQEFFIFKNKHLKKIESYELDYIESKIETMKDETDRMMIVSYITSKKDLVEYYIALLNNPKYAKKYVIPHTKEQLEIMKKKLDMYTDKALSHKIPMANRVSYITWPSGPARALYMPTIDNPEGYEG